MEQYSNSIIIALLFLLATFWYSQTKFKDKMLCYFLRPNKQRIKKWVPLYSRHVIFDRGKYGIQQYRVDPTCIVLEWWNGGVNKLFPILVPTLDFRWDTPNPVSPETSQSSWHTPEVEAAGYQGQSYVGLARAMALQGGMKRNKIAELIPIITLGVLVIAIIVGYQFISSIDTRIGGLEQIINLKIK